LRSDQRRVDLQLPPAGEIKLSAVEFLIAVLTLAGGYCGLSAMTERPEDPDVMARWRSIYCFVAALAAAVITVIA
jgi:hypothetical protein